jgi:hypothetical protein
VLTAAVRLTGARFALVVDFGARWIAVRARVVFGRCVLAGAVFFFFIAYPLFF